MAGRVAGRVVATVIRVVGVRVTKVRMAEVVVGAAVEMRMAERVVEKT